MEEILEREINDLKQQQTRLEQELMAIDELSGESQSSGLIDINTLQSSIYNNNNNNNNDYRNTFNGRIDDLEEIRHRYQREANRALRQYFNIISDYPRYQSNREKKLNTARPFSFETRELQRTQRIRSRRLEEERIQRENEIKQKLNHRFKASPVPPSTYMNKYDLMVEEWRQRKAAVEALAIEKAKRIKEESEMIRLSAESLHQVREVMGVRNTDNNSNNNKLKSAEVISSNRRGVVELREIPLEVKMKLWPALEEHEQIRKERIKYRAAEKLKEIQMEEIQNATKIQNEQLMQAQFGVTPSVIIEQLGPLNSSVISPGVPNVSNQNIQGGITTTTTTGVNTLLSNNNQQQQQQQQPIQKKKNEKALKDVKYNSNLTFRPKIRDGVPNFNAMWAEERLALAERRSKRQTTEVQPFNITESLNSKNIRGKSAVPPKRFISATRKPQRSKSSTVKEKSETLNPTLHNDNDNNSNNVEKKVKNIIPKGTRAHAMRTQAVFSKYINSNEGNKTTEGIGGSYDELAELQEAYQRQKIVNARLKEYLKGTQNNTDIIIKEKVRALRRRNREIEREAAERLHEMQTRVAQMPPLFVEPTHLHDLAKTRVETEKEIIQMLNDTGVDGSTLAAILSGTTGITGGDASTIDNIIPGNESIINNNNNNNNNTGDNSNVEISIEEGKKEVENINEKEGVSESKISTKVKNDSETDTDSNESSSDDSSSDSSSNDSTIEGGKGGDYDDDDFEDTSSSSSNSSS